MATGVAELGCVADDDVCDATGLVDLSLVFVWINWIGKDRKEYMRCT